MPQQGFAHFCLGYFFFQLPPESDSNCAPSPFLPYTKNTEHLTLDTLGCLIWELSLGVVWKHTGKNVNYVTCFTRQAFPKTRQNGKVKSSVPLCLLDLLATPPCRTSRGCEGSLMYDRSSPQFAKTIVLRRKIIWAKHVGHIACLQDDSRYSLAKP